MGFPPRSGVGIIAPTPGEHESESGHIATYMMMSIVWHFHSEIHIFTRKTASMEPLFENVTIHRIGKPFASSPWYLRLPGQVVYQIKYSMLLWKHRRRLQLVIFGGSGFFIPILWTKFLRKHTIYRIGGIIQYQEETTAGRVKILWLTIIKFVQRVMYTTADTIVVISPYVAEFAGLERYSHKILSWCHFYFDFELFDCKTPFEEREDVVGQVGIMSEVKGSRKFVEGMTELADSGAPDHRSVMIGDGPLEPELERIAAKRGLDIEFTGRTPRERVAAEMNRMKLLVITSETEGGPKVAWEAMACGTPVVSTEVGMVPDFVVDGENGFLLESNDPSTIASRVAEILARDDLAAVSQAARNTAIRSFSYSKAVTGYRELLETATPITPPPMGEIDVDQIDPYFESVEK